MTHYQTRPQPLVKTIAVVGAGASGAITAAALHAENHFEHIRVFERRHTAGGTWIYDPSPDHTSIPRPGALPTETDPPIQPPRLRHESPTVAAPNTQQRYELTPVYEDLTTNVPDIAMSFSDAQFAYGPFVPHWIPRQYIENYFSVHGIDKYLQLGTTVEDVSELPEHTGWKLTLRKYDNVRDVDEWWQEEFDSVIIANGHYSIPYIPQVQGLESYIEKFPGRVQHSKTFRKASQFEGKRVLVIGNSASGHDVTASLLSTAALPVFQSRRSAARWDGKDPPDGIAWKGLVTDYLPSGRIVFEDGSYLDDIDVVVYCTGYKPSFPFWNAECNGGSLWDYEQNRLPGTYLHTFLSKHPTIGLVGVPRVLTFRGFEYQAVALARVLAGRSKQWPSISEETKGNWDEDRLQLVLREKRKFHDILWDNGETWEWMNQLYDIAGLATLGGDGRLPPPLGEKVRWAVENIKKYPELNVGLQQPRLCLCTDANEWTIVERSYIATDFNREKDWLSFI